MTGGVAQMVEYLPGKCEALSLNSSYPPPKKNYIAQGMVTNGYKLSYSGEAIRRILVPG
jgi:hypothetical protein